MPEEMMSVGRLMNFPPVPEVPDPLRGKSFAVLEAVYCGDPADGEELVAPLRELGNAVIDTVAIQPPAGIEDLHMDPPTPVPYTSETLLTHELPPEAIDSLVQAVGPGSDSQLASVELRHCGGALSRASQDAGALATLPGSFLAFGVGFVPVPEAMAPNRTWLGAFKAALEPYDAGRYFNFVEESFDITQIFAPEVLERLREVKQRYDPENLFHSNHPVTG
jgi:FAD/FMN-containing dehydrogenase